MEEEDGRPGPRARQFGPDGVLTDALADSLRHPLSKTCSFTQRHPSAHLRRIHKDLQYPILLNQGETL
jgi:hypothetical protein